MADRQLTKSPMDWERRTVGIPFTTPMLCGSKARPAGRGQVELLVPNPSGGRGHYVLELKLAGDLCQLTVHDELLLERLLGLDIITPAAVRRTAREVALSGAAGRDAAEAASKATKEDDTSFKVTNYLLLLRLFRKIGIDPRELAKADIRSTGLRHLVRDQLTAAAPDLGMDVDELLDTLEEISLHACSIGFASGEFVSQHQATLKKLGVFSTTIKNWANVETEETREHAEQIFEAADWTVEQVKPMLAECQASLEDITTLLREWRDGSKKLAERFAMCDWLLDGWPNCFALWSTVKNDGRPMQREAVTQIFRLLPLAKAASEPRELDLRTDAREYIQARTVKLHEDWKTGMIQSDLRERVERARAENAR